MQIREKLIQNLDHLALYDLIQFVEQAVKDGFSAPPMEDNDTFPKRHGAGSYYVAMVKDDGEKLADYTPAASIFREPIPEQEGETNKVKLLEGCKSVDDLKAFAQNELGIAVPADKVKFIAIRNHLKKVIDGDIES